MKAIAEVFGVHYAMVIRPVVIGGRMVWSRVYSLDKYCFARPDPIIRFDPIIRLSSEANRLQKQTKDMLTHTSEAVAIVYTWKNIYVVDADDYANCASPASRSPLSQNHRLITLGTYLGKWLPRCTKGDTDEEIITRAKHLEDFKHGVELNVVADRPEIDWDNNDSAEEAWRERGKKKSK